MKSKKVEKAIKEFKNKHILVVGDVMLDQYTFGEVSRISPEAPVPILKKIDEKFVPGGAGNVASNLASLGAKVTLCGIVGNDFYKEMLLRLLADQGIDTAPILTIASRPTICKHRFVSGSNHQLLRLDIEENNPLDLSQEKKLISPLEKTVKAVDAIVLADYAKGVFSQHTAQYIIKLAKKNKKRIIVDLKPLNKALFKGADVITPNRKEAQEMVGVDNLQEVGKNLVRYFEGDVIVTKSQEGMSVFKKDGTRTDLPTRKINVFDVSGAGDTVSAVVALGIVSGLDIRDAAWLANYAGGIVVQKPGTAVITVEELEASLQEERHIEAVEVLPKVWGYEKWLENNKKYCSKLLFLKQGYQSSLHFHKLKDEMFLVTKGHVRLEIGKKVRHMRNGNFVRIRPGVLHRFRGIEESEILEISTHHKEGDTYRVESSRKVQEEETTEPS